MKSDKVLCCMLLFSFMVLTLKKNTIASCLLLTEQAQNKRLCTVVTFQHKSWHLCLFLYLIFNRFQNHSPLSSMV